MKQTRRTLQLHVFRKHAVAFLRFQPCKVTLFMQPENREVKNAVRFWGSLLQLKLLEAVRVQNEQMT